MILLDAKKVKQQYEDHIISASLNTNLSCHEG